MASEATIADTWIYSRLTGDAALVAAATGGIHNNRPPQGTDPPYVVFIFIIGEYFNAGGGSRRGTRLTYDVSAYTVGGSVRAADDMAEHIDALLNVSEQQTVSVDGAPAGAVTSRTTNMLGQPPNVLAGITTNKRGHTVQVTVQKT